jgi:hypothetical protein
MSPDQFDGRIRIEPVLTTRTSTIPTTLNRR